MQLRPILPSLIWINWKIHSSHCLYRHFIRVQIDEEEKSFNKILLIAVSKRCLFVILVKNPFIFISISISHSLIYFHAVWMQFLYTDIICWLLGERYNNKLRQMKLIVLILQIILKTECCSIVINDVFEWMPKSAPSHGKLSNFFSFHLKKPFAICISLKTSLKRIYWQIIIKNDNNKINPSSPVIRDKILPIWRQ